MPDGNSEQVRIIAEQLYSQWKRDQDEQRKPFNIQTACTIFALVISLATFVWQAGVTTQRLNDTVRRVETIEAFGLDKNFARLEAKVDMLVEESNRGRRQSNES